MRDKGKSRYVDSGCDELVVDMNETRPLLLISPTLQTGKSSSNGVSIASC